MPVGLFSFGEWSCAASITEIQQESLATTENYVAVMESTLLRHVARWSPFVSNWKKKAGSPVLVGFRSLWAAQVVAHAFVAESLTTSEPDSDV